MLHTSRPATALRSLDVSFSPALLAIGVLALALLAGGRTAAAEVRTEKSDTEVLLAGELVFDGVLQDNFWNGGSGAELIYPSAMFRLSLDLRLSATAKAYISLQTPRRFTSDLFGVGVPRARGWVLGRDDAGLELDEAFLQVERFLIEEISVRLGQQHLSFSVDTAVRELWWDGHGAVWLDTSVGRAPASFSTGGEFDPVGLTVWLNNMGMSAFNVSAGAFFLRKDVDILNSNAALFAVWGDLLLTEDLLLYAAYAYNLFDFDEDYQHIWIAAKWTLDRGLHIYGDFNFQAGDNIESAFAALAGLTFVSADQNLFFDISWILATGDNPLSPQREEFRGGSGIADLLIIESDGFGMGRHEDYTVWKIVGAMRLDYQSIIRIAAGIAESHATSKAPGVEIDISFVYRPAERLELSATAATIFESRVFGPGGDSDGVLLFITGSMGF